MLLPDKTAAILAAIMSAEKVPCNDRLHLERKPVGSSFVRWLREPEEAGAGREGSPMNGVVVIAAATLAIGLFLPVPEASGQAQAPGSQPVERIKPNQYRGSQLIGAEVYGPNVEKIGKVEDVILEEDGRISQLVLSISGVLGIGGKNVTIPLSEIKLDDMKDGRLALTRSKEQLESQPRFELEYPSESTQPGGSSGPSTPSPQP